MGRVTELLLESALAKIMRDPRYIEGIMYGKPRTGHDEGTVANHIVELEGNLLRIGVGHSSVLDEEEALKLLILIHVHDTFKMTGKRLTDNHQVSLRDPRSHASLAKNFLAEFVHDDSMLAIAQFHDEGHALWKQWLAKGHYNETRLREALAQIPDIELFLLFTVIDGYTKSKLKDRSPKWFLDVVYNHTVPPKPYRAYEALRILEERHGN
jgi:hypothetical protein